MCQYSVYRCSGRRVWACHSRYHVLSIGTKLLPPTLESEFRLFLHCPVRYFQRCLQGINPVLTVDLLEEPFGNCPKIGKSVESVSLVPALCHSLLAPGNRSKAATPSLREHICTMNRAKLGVLNLEEAQLITSPNENMSAAFVTPLPVCPSGLRHTVFPVAQGV